MAANELRTLLRNEGGGRVHLVPTAWGAQTHAKLVAGDSRTHWGHREAPTRPHRLSEDGRHVSCKRSNTGCFWVSQESAGGDTGQALLECRRKIASNTLLNLQISHPSGGRAGKFLCILFMWWLWGGGLWTLALRNAWYLPCSGGRSWMWFSVQVWSSRLEWHL